MNYLKSHLIEHLLAAAGGLERRSCYQSTFFQFQTQDNATVSSVTPDDEGGSSTILEEAEAHNRAFFRFSTKQHKYLILHKQLSGEIYRFNYQKTSKNSDPALALAGNNPINDELAYQMELVLETVAKKVEWSAFNGTYNDGTSGDRQMRGLDHICSLSGGNIVFHDTAGDGSGTAQKLNFDIIASAMKTLYDAGAPMRNLAFFLSTNSFT